MTKRDEPRDRIPPVKRDELRPKVEIPPHVRKLVYWLEELVRIPGTSMSFGLDALLGLFPGAGDSITAVASVSLLVTAMRRGVPTVILTRMVLNILIDLIGGAVPFVGDAFDFFFKSNKRNLVLLEKYEYEEQEPGIREYAIVGVGFVLIALSIVIPIVLTFFLGAEIASLFSRQ